MKKLLYITLFILAVAPTSFGQLVTTANSNATQLAQALSGTGVTVSNVRFTGRNGSAGTFNAANTNLGMANGIMLTTGMVTLAQGPNAHNAEGYDHLAPGDTLLNALANDLTVDACVLEFDMNVLSDSIQFKYVFGSEEYPEWVTASYNDAFAFFISGPGITGQENIALVPGTRDTPVTIHNINANVNSQFYHANGDGFSAPFNAANTYLQYDGLTTVLTAKKKGLQPCNTYHLKLMIADAGDGIYDSGVFLEANSLTSNFISIDDSASTGIPNAPIAAEGCSNTTVRFRVQTPVTQPTMVHFTIGGNAVNGVDYTFLPDSVLIPAGSASAAITINPIRDAAAENIEAVIIKLMSTCNNKAYDSIMVLISDSAYLTLNAGADQSICAGDQANLTATGAGIINWTAASSLNITSGTTAIAAPATTTTYKVTSQVGTCRLQNLVNVNVTSAPFSVNAGTDVTACAGATAQLNATVTGNTVNGNAFTYNWSGAGLSATNVANPTLQVTNSTNYILEVASGNCRATDTVAVNLSNGNISASATATAETCHGYNNGTATVNATGGSSFNYVWSNNAATKNVTGLAGGSYQVTVTDNAGCTASAMATVTSTNPIYFSHPAISPVKCNGSADGLANITAAGGNGTITYMWSNGSNSATTTNLEADKAYTISATDANGCIADTTIMLAAPAQFTVSVTATNVKCAIGGNGNTINLNAGKDGAANATAVGGKAPYAYRWNTATADLTAEVANLSAGSYKVTVADANNCTASGAVNITEPVEPMSITAASLAPACGNSTNGTINANCTGGTGAYNFSLNYNNSVVNANSTGAFSSLAAGDYVISVSDANNCIKTANLNLAQATADAFTINTTAVSCNGGNNGAITIIPVNVLNQPYQYSLNGSAAQQLNEFYNVTAGTHNLHITSNSGCVTDTTVAIAEPAAAVLEIIPSSTVVELGGTVELNTNFSSFNTDSAVTYNWSPMEGLTCLDCANTTVNSYAKSNEYTLTVTYNGNCKAVASAKVEVTGNNVAPFVPNAFTPNGDGMNDVFMVFGEGISKVDMQIFNRWGEKVFESASQSNGWDGTYKGQLQNTGTFVYQITAVYLDGRTVNTNGTITLIR